jgi:Cu2+-exporting ATPase
MRTRLTPRLSFMAISTAVSCTHCGLPVPDGLLVDGTGDQFCCAGCRTAYAIIHTHGLDRYYALPQQRDRPVQPSGRSYAEFDHPAFHALYVQRTGDGLDQIELYLEGVHCASCVWLIERLPLILPGVARAELQVRRSLATIEWDSATVSLSAIAQQLDTLGYRSHPYRGVRRDAVRRAEDRAMLVRIGVAGAIAINVMLAALALYSGWLGDMEREWERLFRWTSLVLVTPALLWPGRVFFTGALAALRTRGLTMDVPIALGLAAGYVRGTINTVTDTGPVYFDGLAMLTFALLVGRYLQARGQRAAADSTELLYSLTPRSARVVRAGGISEDLPAEALAPGCMIDVRAGESFAADGVVEAGSSAVDMSLLTGESRPAHVSPGAQVFAGTLNLSSGLRVRVTEASESSRVARLMHDVEESAQRRAPVVQLANRLAGVFVAVVLILAAATWVGWAFFDQSRAVDNAIALLIVTCPCALALSTPLAVSVAIGRAARRGILVKGGDALERLARPSTLLLDKTGTITEALARVVAFEGPEWVKPIVVAMEEHSNHPIAEALRRSWPTDRRVQDADIGAVHDVEVVAGKGVSARVGMRNVRVGSASFCGTTAPASCGTAFTPVFVTVDDAPAATIWIGDAIRGDAPAAVARLRERGWRLGILSGDAQSVVTAVGDTLGIDRADCMGDAVPETKLELVRSVRAKGDVVMVGDGVNDAPAMAAASVGIGVHGGAEACLQTADVYLTRPGLTPLVELTEGARRTMRIIRRNMVFSLIYNVIGASLAIAGVLTPLIAAVLMPASSLTVLVASWRSRTFDPPADASRDRVRRWREIVPMVACQ